MNVSYNWLREYCDLKQSPDELTKLLPELGIEVESIDTVGGDTVFECEITANRPDLLSMIGVAREVAAGVGAPLTVPDVKLDCQGDDVAGLTRVELECPDLCLRYTARLIRGVTIGTSPDWLLQRLEAVGLRPVNNIVDITNFVLMECGQPLHAFDFDKLRGGRIVVRAARPGEKITVIDGTEHKLDASMCVIADAEVPTAVAGVMGGLDTEIGDATTNVLLESAEFLPANIRRTSRALGLASDSSYRFERGVDPQGIDWGSERAAVLIAEIAGGTVESGVIDVGRPAPQPAVVQLRPDRARMLIGADIADDEQCAMLERLGFSVVAKREGEMDVRVPTSRAEVHREVDLIEEITRAYGYSKVPEKTQIPVRAVPAQKFDIVSRKVRELCAGMGYHEARTSSFIAPAVTARFTHWSENVNLLRNAMSAEEPALRTSLIPALLGVKRTNANRGAAEVALFELTRVYGVADGKPGERTCLTLLDDSGFPAVRGALDRIFGQLNVADRVVFSSRDDANFAAGRGASIMLDGQLLGVLGEIGGDLAASFDLKSCPVVAELDFNLLLDSADLSRQYQPLPKFPAVHRDLCVVVDRGVAWQDIAGSVRADGPPLTEAIEFLSVYEGEKVASGKKAVAFAITYRADDRTLTGEEADAAVRQVVDALGSKFGAKLRT
jgi:phenylalanyl-tRNA synthetase beta chain